MFVNAQSNAINNRFHPLRLRENMMTEIASESFIFKRLGFVIFPSFFLFHFSWTNNPKLQKRTIHAVSNNPKTLVNNDGTMDHIALPTTQWYFYVLLIGIDGLTQHFNFMHCQQNHNFSYIQQTLKYLLYLFFPKPKLYFTKTETKVRHLGQKIFKTFTSQLLF